MKMSARQQILSRPLAVQEVLKCMIVRLSLDCEEAGEPKAFEDLVPEAIRWWEMAYAQASAILPTTESAMAEALIQGLRKQEVWGAIMRGNAN